MQSIRDFAKSAIAKYRSDKDKSLEKLIRSAHPKQILIKLDSARREEPELSPFRKLIFRAHHRREL